MRAQFLTRRQRLLWLVFGFSGGVCAACAGSPPPSQERIDTAFRAIQRAEARIEAAAREVDRVAGTIADDAGACVERCDPFSQGIAQARDGAAAVCESAATIDDDNDARVRCARARDRSAAIAQRAGDLRARCGCGPIPAPSDAP
jgi:hypothetical protein